MIKQYVMCDECHERPIGYYHETDGQTKFVPKPGSFIWRRGIVARVCGKCFFAMARGWVNLFSHD